jgi:hypothetical protein
METHDRLLAALRGEPYIDLENLTAKPPSRGRPSGAYSPAAAPPAEPACRPTELGADAHRGTRGIPRPPRCAGWARLDSERPPTTFHGSRDHDGPRRKAGERA